MAIYETLSKRQKKLSKQGESDPYRYDIFPPPLRVQVIKLLTKSLGNFYSGYGHADAEAAPRWERVHGTLAHEYGVFELAKGRNAQEQCLAFFLQTNKAEECLDFVELSFRLIQQMAAYYSWPVAGFKDTELGV